MKQARYQFLLETEKEKEGYTKSVKALLLDCEKDGSLKKGICGVLANLISTEKEYEVAIEMCLGQALQNIVTEKEEDAKKLIEHLRSNNLGRASFLPISSVHGKPLEKISQSGIQGVIGVASNLVKYDRKYEQIVTNLLGRTVIVENMESAISLAKANHYAFRIVTLKGDIINPSGAMTGGSVAQKTVNILGRSREIEELEKELKKIAKKIEEKTAEKEKYSVSIADVIEETAKLEKDLQDINITYATEKQKMVAVEEQIFRLEERLSKLKEELKLIDIQKQENRAAKEKKENEIANLSQQIEGLNRTIEEFARNNKDNQKYIDDLNFDITNLKISVSSFDESESSIDEMVARIAQDIENNQKSIENKKQTLVQMKEENNSLQDGIVTLYATIEQIKLEVNNSSQKVEELKQERTSKNEKLTKTENEIASQFSVLEGLKEQMVKLDVKKTKLEQDLQQVMDNLWNEYELTPNNAEGYQKPNNVATAQKQVNTLRNRIRDLGSINIDSIEEYKKTKERYDFMNEQRLDLENTVAKLRNIINEITENMKIQFKEK